jgi:hypothetical protein
MASDNLTVALWHFDDGAGQTAVDSSGNNRTLTLGPSNNQDASDPAWDNGRIDGGLRFSANDEDYATRNGGNTFPDNELSVEFWVRTTDAGYAQVFTAGFINCFVAVQNNGAGFDFGIGDGNNWNILTAGQAPGTVNDGAWHYVAATYDGNTMRVYFDGAEIDSQASAINLADPGDYKVGGRPANTFLDGWMDEVRLSRTARTGQQIGDYWASCK